MAKKFLTPINVTNLSSDPASANEGDIYYNTVSDALKIYANGVWGNAGGGSGTVTSVGVSVPTGLSVANSPITTSGTIAISLASGYTIPTTAALDAKAPLASPTFTGTVNSANIVSTGTIRSVAFSSGYTTTATSNGTLTLTSASNQQQFFTGSSNHTVVLPVTSTLTQGHYYHIYNNSTGSITVNSSGSNAILTVPAGMFAKFVCILTSGTTAASWSARIDGSSAVTGTGSMVLSVSPTFTGTPISTTAAVGTNTNQIATTAFVNSEISNDTVLKSGGSFTGEVSGVSPTAIGSNGFRNIVMSTSEPTGGSDGDVWIVYQ